MSAQVFCWTCLVLVLGFGCHRPPVERAAPPATSPVSPTRIATPSADSLPKTARAPAPVPESAKAEDDLQSEEREANPLSQTVTLTLAISPPVKAFVMWGSKQLARVAPDNPTIELQRPRSSGPLDFDIRAEGFLPHHTRLYTDRNDKVNVHLVREAEAPSLLGYRAPAAAPAAKGKAK
jgi:hypothetical protein